MNRSFVVLVALLGAMALAQEVRIDGSSTVYPITLAVAEEFSIENPDANVSVAFSGTGGGFKKFCVGEVRYNRQTETRNDRALYFRSLRLINSQLLLECSLCTLFQTEVQSVGPVHGSIEAIPQQQLHSLHGATYCEF